jgi:hypothetical protein
MGKQDHDATINRRGKITGNKLKKLLCGYAVIM